MGWIISTVIATIICGLIGAVGLVAWRKPHWVTTDKEDYPSVSGTGGVILVVGVIVFVLWVGISALFASIHQVPAGHVGLVYQFGDIVGQRDAGFNLIAPWQGFKVASIRTQKVRAESTCFDGQWLECLEAFSSETQDVFIRTTVNLHVGKEDIQDLFRNVGEDYLNILVRPRLHQIVKDETVKYKSVDIAPSREKIRTAIRTRLTTELEKFSIVVEDLLIDNVDFRPEFKAAIEDKVTAEQEAQAAANRVAKAKSEADQVAATALGAKQKLISEAQGQAEANNLISASLTPMLIQFQALQKLAPDLKIALLPSGQGIIIDPAQLLGMGQNQASPAP